MTVGKFTRELKQAVNAEGYTCNNVQIIGVIEYLQNPNLGSPRGAFCIELLGNDGNEFSVFIEEA